MPQCGKANLPSGPIHYLDDGAGPVVLLIHAFPLNHTMWRPQQEILVQSGYRVIAPDVRGFGASAVSGPWSIEEFSDDLRALLDQLHVEKATVAGLSMGGYIALPFYARHSNRVERLILADTRARGDNETEKEGRTEMIAALQQSGNVILPDRMLPRLLKPNPAPDAVRTVRDIMKVTSAEAAIYALMAIRDRPDQSSLLHRIHCPALVIAGEHDSITRVEECREMAATIPSARFIEIPNAGHLSNIENPEAFNRAITE